MYAQLRPIHTQTVPLADCRAKATKRKQPPAAAAAEYDDEEEEEEHDKMNLLISMYACECVCVRFALCRPQRRNRCVNVSNAFLWYGVRCSTDDCDI